MTSILWGNNGQGQGLCEESGFGDKNPETSRTCRVRLWRCGRFFGRRNKSQKSCFQVRHFVGTGKTGGETEAFLNSKNELLHTFENVCSEISSAISNGTREGTQPDFLWVLMTPPEQRLGTLRIYSRCNPILTSVSYFISLLRATTYCSYKRPIQISNKRIVKHKKNHLFCAPQERQSWPLKRQSVLFSISFLLEKSVQ